MRSRATSRAAAHARRSTRALDGTSQVAIRDILFATDFSSAAEKALAYATEIARRYEATLHVVHVIAPMGYPFAPVASWPKLEEEEDRFRQESKRRIELRLHGLPHETDFRRGQVVPVLQETIQAKHIDLLVLGTHGRTGIDKAMMGSVAESIFREAACPVMTVGPRVSTDSHSAAELGRILFATDFSPESLAAAPYAISLCREHRAQLILMNSIEGQGDARMTLRALRELVPFGTDVRDEPICVAERGPHGHKILAACEAHGADLLVLGAAKHSAENHAYFRRSSLYKIVTQATCPVLTVRT